MMALWKKYGRVFVRMFEICGWFILLTIDMKGENLIFVMKVGDLFLKIFWGVC